MKNIRDSEESLLPLYNTIIDEIPQGGAIKFFIRENKLIRKNLDSFVHNISNIVMYDSGNEVNLVKLFESYHSFKDLLDLSEALVLVTPHQQFLDINLEELRESKVRVIIDGRNCLNKEEIQKMGIAYRGIGR